jgi:hypothetical protein
MALAYALLRGWPASLPQVMRACAAVLVLVAALGIWAQRRPLPEIRAQGRRVPRWLDYAAIGAAVLAVECGFLWLLASAPQPLESIGLAIERRFRPDAAALRAVTSSGGAVRHGNWLWSEETRRPLPKRTDFKPGTKPEVFLRLQHTDDVAVLLKGKIHVQAFALGRYENAGWAPIAGSSLELQADADGFIRIGPARQGREIRHEVFHGNDPSGQNVFTALSGASAAGISQLTRIDDGLHLLPPPGTFGGYQYFATSSPLRIEDLPAASLIRPWPGAAAELLALPDPADFATRIRELARQAAGTGTIKEQLLRLQNHLRTHLDYSLVTTNPLDLDPMVNFLFEEKRGHCEYFATAGALMARALGIPSRVAYGWAGGKWYESAGLFVFRANEAHAWTEVWLENHGWVLMDPTPEAGQGDGRARVAAPNESLPEDLAGEADAESSDPSARTSDFPKLALWLMAGFAIPATLLALLRTWRRGGGSNVEDLDPDSPIPPAPGYLQLWRQACAARGKASPPGCTLRRQIAKLDPAPDFAAELLGYHYTTRYEGHPPDAQTEKQLTQRIRRWRDHG